MATKFEQIQRQIDDLQKRADALRERELSEVVDRIKVAIAHYGLTATQLGLEPGRRAKRSSSADAKAKAKATFGDQSGNVWSGRGPRPHWLRDALVAGHSLEEFRLVPGSVPGRVTAKKGRKIKPPPPPKVIYADESGNSWSGRGPRPKWLRAALESGRSLQDFAK